MCGVSSVEECRRLCVWGKAGYVRGASGTREKETDGLVTGS